MRETRIWGVTHTGCVRQRNEDSYGALGLGGVLSGGKVNRATVAGAPCLAVVADGLGGHPRGDAASRVAVDAILEFAPTTAEELIRAIHLANDVVYRQMGALDAPGMGTTIAALLVHEHGFAVANVGDSPVFELSDGRLVKLSVDDVPPGQAGLPGIPTSRVTQTLGGSRSLTPVRPHLHVSDHVDHSRLLLCTDGLTNFATQSEIAAELRRPDGGEAATALVQLALAAGGLDNVTVVVVELLR